MPKELKFPHKPAPSKSCLVVNGRFRLQRLTGVQRYAQEIVSRLSDHLEILVPVSAKGVAGHLWEQTVLPWSCDGRLLWSPNASGPVGYGKQVVTFHDIFPIEHPEWYSPAYAKWYGMMMRRLAAQSLHLIAVSEFTKSRIVQVLGRAPEDISVISNGCHVKKRSSGEEIAASLQMLALPSRRYILTLSSLEKRKNIRGVLQAWSVLHSELPQDVWLVIAGPPADIDVYGKQAEASDLPRVFYTGYVPDEHLPGLYSGASLFVFPSLAEGFGLPLLEAMACGVRCIASNTSSLPEVGGDAVEYFDPTDPVQLVQTMKGSFSKSSLDAYGPSLKQSMQFTWEAAAHKTLDVLQSSLEASMSNAPFHSYISRSAV